jgi:hypothetical protein
VITGEYAVALGGTVKESWAAAAGVMANGALVAPVDPLETAVKVYPLPAF